MIKYYVQIPKHKKRKLIRTLKQYKLSFEISKNQPTSNTLLFAVNTQMPRKQIKILLSRCGQFTCQPYPHSQYLLSLNDEQSNLPDNTKIELSEIQNYNPVIITTSESVNNEEFYMNK